MPCFFCDSNDHISIQCDIYTTEEARKRIFRIKRRCPDCTDIPNTLYMADEFCQYCNFNRKCYSCYTRSHYPKNCPNPLTSSNCFPPNIDHNLLSRYLKLLMFEEKYYLIFTYPRLSNLITPHPVRISCKKYLYFPSNQGYHALDFAVVEKAVFDKLADIGKYLVPKNFRIKKLEFRLSDLSAADYIKLLTIKTKTIKCTNVNFFPQLTFREILRNAPYLHKIDFIQTNITITKTWLDDSLFLNHSNYLKYIRLTIPDLNFCVKNLANLIKKKHANICLIYKWPRIMYFSEKVLKNVTNKLSSHFVPEIFKPLQLLQVSFKYKYEGSDCYESEYYKLKDI